MKASFLDAGTLGEGCSLQPLQSISVDWTFFPTTHPNQTLSRVADCEIVVTNKVLLNADILKASPNLKLICIAATGTNCVDLHTAKQLGITVCNIPSYSSPSVVQLTILFLIALTTQFLLYAKAGKERWPNSPYFSILDYPIGELAGKTLGIIGYGDIGKRVEKVAQSLEMNIQIARHTDPHKYIKGAISLQKLLAEADFISIHTPLNPQTAHLIRAQELQLMKPTAFLINVSRGGIVHEKDLADALKNGTIAGAALDVLSQEPPPADHPLLQKDVPNLLLTPHIGWASTESRNRLLEILKENILSFLKGHSINTV